jgi:hypothetical protein
LCLYFLFVKMDGASIEHKTFVFVKWNKKSVKMTCRIIDISYHKPTASYIGFFYYLQIKQLNYIVRLLLFLSWIERNEKKKEWVVCRRNQIEMSFQYTDPFSVAFFLFLVVVDNNTPSGEDCKFTLQIIKFLTFHIS